jgi:hypothetical protein
MGLKLAENNFCTTEMSAFDLVADMKSQLSHADFNANIINISQNEHIFS